MCDVCVRKRNRRNKIPINKCETTFWSLHLTKENSELHFFTLFCLSKMCRLSCLRETVQYSAVYSFFTLFYANITMSNKKQKFLLDFQNNKTDSMSTVQSRVQTGSILTNRKLTVIFSALLVMKKTNRVVEIIFIKNS